MADLRVGKTSHEKSTSIPESKKFPREQSETAELTELATGKLEDTNEAMLRRLSNKEMGLADRSVTHERVGGDTYLACQRHIFNKRIGPHFKELRHTNSSPVGKAAPAA